MEKFADLEYTDEELQEDAIRFFKTQIYQPSYMQDVKDFLADDLDDFKYYYDDDQYAFQTIYYDEYITGYEEKDDRVLPQTDYRRLCHDLEDSFSSLSIEDDEIERYALNLENEFRKNSFLSHMEAYFLGEEAVAATVVAGYSRDPIFSIYSIVREWAMALHLKKMQPELIRKFGYRYQYICENFTGDERLRRLLDYRDKYKQTLKNVGALRVVHSSVFAYVYLYIRACLTGESEKMEDFILDTSASQLMMLLQGETLQVIEFPIVKYALRKLKIDGYRILVHSDATIDWDKLYEFVIDVIHSTGGMSNLRSLGFDGISAKTIRSYWNKSSNLQQMLKILRRLSMDNSDPVFKRLIEMCEYRLGRPASKKKKMQRFIEMTRRIMEEERMYELTKPRTMAQELLAAFPSVFLVYFQWHHNFRTIYPKVTPKQAYNEKKTQENRQAQATLSTKIYSEDKKVKEQNVIQSEQKQKNIETSSKLSLSLSNKEEKQRREEYQKEQANREQRASVEKNNTENEVQSKRRSEQNQR